MKDKRLSSRRQFAAYEELLRSRAAAEASEPACPERRSRRRVRSSLTTFVIAHRLSTIAHADRIVLLEQGGIREIGTHEELMATEGKYRAMIQDQIDVSGDLAVRQDHNNLQTTITTQGMHE